MRPSSTATAALLANPPPGLQSADLFTFTLRDGVTIYRWTSYDRDLLVNGDVYSSRKPWLQRSRWGVANTMAVPTLEVQLLALNDAFGGGLDIKAQLTHGLFDGASATLDRVFFAAGTTVINDLVSETAFTPQTTVNLSAITNAAFSDSAGLTAGVTIGGLSLSTTYRLSLFRGTYTAYSYVADPNVDPAVHYSGSANGFRALKNGNAALMTKFGFSGWDAGQFGTPPTGGWIVPLYNGFEAAISAFTPGTITGASSLTFYIYDAPASDNTGGLSIAVESGSPVGRSHAGVWLFGGNVANIDITGNSATINIKGKSNLLDQYAPRNLYQLGCEHAFCDAGCTLLRASYITSYTVGSGSGGATRAFIPWSSAPGTPNRYRYGTVTFTTGVCSGQARTVRLGDSTGLTLTQPLLGTPAAGDNFTAFEGCDKQFNSGSGQDCTARSNTQHWRAFPYVPPADSAA